MSTDADAVRGSSCRRVKGNAGDDDNDNEEEEGDEDDDDVDDDDDDDVDDDDDDEIIESFMGIIWPQGGSHVGAGNGLGTGPIFWPACIFYFEWKKCFSFLFS